MNNSKIELEEIEHLKHMENAIIPILVALSILGFALRIGEKNILSETLISYLLGSALILSIIHLYFLILKDMKGRLAMFFVDAVFLFLLPIASISIIILYILVGDMNILINPLPKIIGLTVSVIISTLLMLFIIYKKLIPAFEDKIFPVLYKKYRLPKFKYKSKKILIKNKQKKQKKESSNSDTAKWENEKCFVRVKK